MTVALAASGPQSITVPLPASQFVLIGNPGQAPVHVRGADIVDVYDPIAAAYEAGTTLLPGQGAWAFSTDGGTLCLDPE